jgi:hypothetical protein
MFSLVDYDMDPMIIYRFGVNSGTGGRENLATFEKDKAINPNLLIALNTRR